jgi:GH24 family phage-related lysozyme (muramidase)
MRSNLLLLFIVAACVTVGFAHATSDPEAEQLKGDEGYRDTVYLDTEGKATVGWGHRIYNVPVGTSYAKKTNRRQIGSYTGSRRTLKLRAQTRKVSGKRLLR